jgi:hypothetical protein
MSRAKHCPHCDYKTQKTTCPNCNKKRPPKYFCQDCQSPVSDYRIKRCRKCAADAQVEKNRGKYKKTGGRSRREKPYCKRCGNQMSLFTERMLCGFCSRQAQKAKFTGRTLDEMPLPVGQQDSRYSRYVTPDMSGLNFVKPYRCKGCGFKINLPFCVGCEAERKKKELKKCQKIT